MTTDGRPTEKPGGGLWGKTPASQKRRQAILLAAKAVFFEEGYQLASMERIASAAGTTKRTLYDHFGSKDALFAAVIEHGCSLFIEMLPRFDDLPADTETALLAFIERMVALINAPDSVRFQRMVIAEAERHPAFGRILHESAFAAAEQVLRGYLARQVESGQLRSHDVAAWSRLFIGFATNLQYMQSLLAAEEADVAGGDAGLDAHAQIVAMYVRAHRVSEPG